MSVKAVSLVTAVALVRRGATLKGVAPDLGGTAAPRSESAGQAARRPSARPALVRDGFRDSKRGGAPPRIPSRASPGRRGGFDEKSKASPKPKQGSQPCHPRSFPGCSRSPERRAPVWRVPGSKSPRRNSIGGDTEPAPGASAPPAHTGRTISSRPGARVHAPPGCAARAADIPRHAAEAFLESPWTRASTRWGLLLHSIRLVPR